ncbi:Z1 domain-containing protein [Clostridium massiliodielmoense]|uniref:Z1 domain-containing protein n=1 Tax=Clostridium massiliodielmoense TaxID=1776385 RepID=UPI000A267D98|nr:Z1 domain-containing protein [Clostridium massiliodielmoense]
MGFYAEQAKFSMNSDGIPLKNIENVEKISEQLVKYVKGESELTSLLLLGYVQSGKTNGMIMTLAKLIETGYRYYVILTGNDNDLYDQTYTRIECINLGVRMIDKSQLDSTSIQDITQDLDKINVFVVQKYGTYLKSLNKLFEVLDEPFIIIDDEADQASLNTNINNPNTNPSTINGYIASLLRNAFAKAYIQVTATPYALMLQEQNDAFRPKKTFILEPGDGYVGGEKLFLENDSSKYHRVYNINDMIFLNDVSLPKALIDATCNFIVAATLKRLSGYNKSLSFLIHIDHTQITHENASDAIRYLLTRIHNVIKQYRKTMEETILITTLRKEYENLLETCKNRLEFKKIIDYLAYGLENVNNQVINSNYKEQISYNRMYTIIIGGNKLSRGITIKNLITTYYCRNTSSPNMDTVNQHARMYGYRYELEDVMRIFTTNQIIDDFTNITNTDIKLRQYLKENSDTTLIPINHNVRLKATRTSVIPNRELLKFTSGMTVFPHFPIYNDTGVETDTKELDILLKDYNMEKAGQIVPIDVAIQILMRIRYNKISNEKWNHEAIIALLKNKVSEIDGKIRVIVRKNSKISRNDVRGMGSVLSGTDNEFTDELLPILFMYRLNGDSDQGWDNKEFWVPIFRMPNKGTECVTIQCF